MFLKLILFNIALVLVAAERVRYDNYALFKLTPANEDDLKFLKNLYQYNHGLDFWKPPTNVGDFVSVVSPPEIREEFEQNLQKRNIQSQVMLENIQEAFDAQVVSRKKRSPNWTEGQLYWTNYQTIEDIYEWFDRLVQTHGNIVSIVSAGQTHEGRNITGIRIARGNSNQAFLLQGGEIGADWLSPTVVTYIANELIHSEEPEIKAAAEEFVWYIFPLTNLDGFQFSQDSVRLWTKNRRPITSSSIGVDLSKNWNSQWGVSGGSNTPSANNFIGLGPFSEPETRALSAFIDSIGPSLRGFFSFRSFGQRMVIPFAHSVNPMYNYNEMVTVGRRAAGSLSVRYNTQYLVGNSLTVHDGATGSVVDWVKHRFNPTIAATYLLRDTGAWGYTLPVTQIMPTCEETFDSILAVIREAHFTHIL